MSNISHPNLLKILDVDVDYKWFVSEFHFKGTLANYLYIYKGDFAKALKAFRPLVEGVARLHSNGIVHRDIKPKNVFVDKDNNLILGDFGLVYFTDSQHTRISNTLSNVGSRDWMPAWAQGIRVEDIKPTFDVFSLGKLLWSMVSGQSFLRLWYFNESQFNVEKIFPKNRLMRLANPLFNMCIVEKEEDCVITDASDFLMKVDRLINTIENLGDLIATDITRICRVCGFGEYILFVDEGKDGGMAKLGFTQYANNYFKVFTCNYCGHVQWFYLGDGTRTIAWHN